MDVDEILALALEGEKEVAEGKWTIPAVVKDTGCGPMAKCHFCEGVFWSLWWTDETVLREGQIVGLCTNCLSAIS